MIFGWRCIVSPTSRRRHAPHNHGTGLGFNGGSIGITIPENGLCEIPGCRIVKVVAVPSDAGSVSRRQCHTRMWPCRIPRDGNGCSDYSDRMLRSSFESCLTRCQCLGTPRWTRQHCPREAAGNAWRFRCLQCNTPAGEGETPQLLFQLGYVEGFLLGVKIFALLFALYFFGGVVTIPISTE